MMPQYIYSTPPQLSNLLLESDGERLTRVAFTNECAPSPRPPHAAFADAVRWLDIYFAGRQPDFTPAYYLWGITPFVERVLNVVSRIPYGCAVSYGQIARELERTYGQRASAQAVGTALNRNPVCIIIPCHRVIDCNGNMCGYAYGIPNKTELLRSEGVIF